MKFSAGKVALAGVFIAAAATLVLLGAVRAADKSVTGLPADIIRAARNTPGLVIHVGCGDGRGTALLKGTAQQIIHGLDPSAEAVARAREHFASLGLEGVVSASVFDGEHLPYPDNVANVIVAQDRFGLRTSEIRRVLAPGGVAFIKRRSGWTRTSKSLQPGMDEWTHYNYDATNNAVSRDTLVGPPRRLRWQAHPRHARSHEHTASEMALVAAGGRIFYIADEAPVSAIEIPSKWYLVCRDAFNGTLLWQRRMGKFFPHLFLVWNGPIQLQRRVVATSNRVYATLGYLAPVTELDAATGRPLRTFSATEGAEEIICADGVLVAAVRKVTPERKKNLDWILELDAQDKSPLWRRDTQEPVRKKFWQTDRKAPVALVAIDLSSGKQLWRLEGDHVAGYRSVSLCADGGRVFYFHRGNVTCVDLRTGKQVWENKVSANIRAAGGGLLVCTKWTGKDKPWRLVAVSQDDGRVLWDVETLLVRIRDVFIIGDRVWLGGFKPYPKKRGPAWGPYYVSERDLKTGKLLRHIEPDNPGHHHRCYNNKATVKYILGGRRGTEFVDLGTGEVLWNNWARGVCRYGVMPAYGLLYVPPHACGCYITTMLYGFNALATGKPGPARRLDAALEKGPAYSAARGASAKTSREDWPMYRHDAFRTGATAVPAPRRLARTWEVSLGGRLTQPVVADGRVYVARVNEHSLIALDARTGRRLWTFVAGGRIDSPPTALGSIVVFGCRDGCVYAVRARDGALAWRLRVAPQQRFVPVAGQMESAWPVHGAVLLRRGKIFALAGRSSYLDGGMSLVRIDPRTGRIEAAAQLYSPDPKTGKPPKQYGPWGEPGSRADILSADDKYIYLRHLAYDENGREQPKPQPHLYTLTDFTEQIWPHRSYWIYGTNWSISIGCMGRKKNLIYARLFAIGDKVLYGYGRSNVHWSNMLEDGEYRIFAADRATGRRLWQKTLDIHVRAMILAGDGLVVAGPPVLKPGEHWFPDPTRPGQLMVLAADGGTKLAETDLSAPPIFDGIAAAHGRLYVALTNGRLLCLAD